MRHVYSYRKSGSFSKVPETASFPPAESRTHFPPPAQHALRRAPHSTARQTRIRRTTALGRNSDSLLLPPFSEKGPRQSQTPAQALNHGDCLVRGTGGALECAAPSSLRSI
jgi:hypothetical protein